MKTNNLLTQNNAFSHSCQRYGVLQNVFDSEEKFYTIICRVCSLSSILHWKLDTMDQNKTHMSTIQHTHIAYVMQSLKRK